MSEELLESLSENNKEKTLELLIKKGINSFYDELGCVLLYLF